MNAHSTPMSLRNWVEEGTHTPRAKPRYGRVRIVMAREARASMNSPIVVGVSGREPQLQLAWAIEESLRWDVDLLIVHCYTDRFKTELPEPTEEQKMSAKAIIEHAVVVSQGLGVTPDIRLCDGFAGEELVKASEGARLLVIGSSHRSRLSHAMNSSVSSYCVRHTHCPVTIVHHGSSM
jgi:nucleotide-binding universal stress UspA family protein